MPVARIVSIQGSVQIQRSGQSAWSVVRKLDTVVCQRDVLHAGPRSRAALLIDPETLVRLDQSSTISISQTPDETIVEFGKDPGLFQRVATAPNPCGAGYFISRFPRKFRVLTPFVNASVEGTEFLVAMRCESAVVAVFEGRVRAEEVLAASTFSLKEGESVEAGVGQPAAMKLVVKPLDAVQWALYYPPLTEAAGEAVADQKCDQADNAARSVCLVQRAEQRLRSGRVEEAETDVQTLLTLGLGDGDAYALLSTIQVVKNDKAAALDLATRATQLSPNSPRAWIALSYANQASFELEKALTAANKAAELAPGSSTAQARVAELQLSQGRIRGAEKAARAAVAANPNDSRAHMVLGFVHLAQINTKAAREGFLNAIERDSTEPLARLGLGLAIIRDGDLKAGRQQIEIAVALDPTNSLLRSYVGKAYYEENTKDRDKLAATQFGIAKKLDPNDPTPHFYDAILKQTQNRPLDALEEIKTSIAENDNRAVYRSNLLLDQDRATRGISLARTYLDLGFQSQALSEATRSLSLDSTNYSAHRFLSDVYAGEERHEIARVSELLQSQLFQPINRRPVQPHVTFLDLGIQSSDDTLLQFGSDYAALLERDRPLFTGAGVVGSNSTIGDELTLSGVKNRFSYSIGQFHYESDGFRQNNDVTHDIYDAFAQMDITPGFSVQAELRRRETEQGDLVLRGDPELLDPSFRRELDQDVQRLGMRLSPSPRYVFLASLFNFDSELEQRIIPDPLLVETRDEKGNQGELRMDFTDTAYSVTTGLGGYQSRVHQTDTFGTDFSFKRKRATVYGYANLNAPSPLLWTVGMAYDSSKREGAFTEEIDHWNGKLGVQWRLSDQIVLRGAIFETTKTALFVQQTLEPTNVAGFNQFFDDLNGTQAKNQALGLDVSLTPSTHVAATYHTRDLDIPLSVINTGVVLEQHEEEKFASLSFAQSLAKRWTFVAEWNLERIETDGAISPFTLLETQAVPVALRYFAPFGLKVEVRATAVRQEVENLVFPGTDSPSDFTLYDAFLSYRLPMRHGTISLEGRNLTNEDFFYVDLNTRSPEINSPRFIPERQVFLRLSLQF